MPSRTRAQILHAYKTCISRLKIRGLAPQLQQLDIEASKILKEYMHEQNINFQITPAGLHMRNTAERVIQTFKNHFIAGTCTVNPNLPLNLWDKLIPQAIITLNLLSPSRINPKLSAYA